MAGISLREKIERGYVGIGEDGKIRLLPLKNPFALKVDAHHTDPETAKEFIELSTKLRELGQSVTGNVVDLKLQRQIKEVTKRLAKLSERLDPVPVESVIQGEEKEQHRYFCECCFIEMTWRNGPRNEIEKSEKVKLGELAELDEDELQELRDMSFEDLESLRRLNPSEFRKGRDYFAHLPTKGKDYIHDRGPGVSLAKDIRNYLELVAHRNEWDFEVLDNKNKGRILIQISNKEKNTKRKFLIAPFGALSPEDDPQTILITSSQKSGTARRLTIRGLTSSTVDVEATRERLQSGQGDMILIEDYVQTRLSRGNGRDSSGRKTTPRFDRPPVRLGDAVIGIMRLELTHVKGTHEIDHFAFKYAPKYSLIDRADGNAIRTLINQNMYYADRRRIAKDFIVRHSDLTLEFDDRREHQPRFGKGLIVFQPKDTKFGKSKTWSQDLNTRKVVINPYGVSLEKFNAADWKDTLVIFHSRNKSQAAAQRRQFQTWLEQNGVDKASIGLVTLHTSDPAKVRGNMFAFLKQPELPFAISEYPDRDGSPFGDPFDPVVVEPELDFETSSIEASRGTSNEEPTHVRTLLDELGLDESSVQTGIDPALQRFLDHETGMDR
jgi:hypothetical protein